MVPASFIKQRREDHKSFWCPACRGVWYYPQNNKEEKLKVKIATLERQKSYLQQDLRSSRTNHEHEIRVRTGYQGVAAKLKREVGANA